MRVRKYVLGKISEAQGRHIDQCEQCDNKNIIISLTSHNGKEEYAVYCPECHWNIYADNVKAPVEVPF